MYFEIFINASYLTEVLCSVNACMLDKQERAFLENDSNNMTE